MFRHLLAATVAAAGIGLAGTADTAQARDHHHHHGRSFNHGHHHGNYFGGRGGHRIQSNRYFGRSGFRGHRGGYYGRPYYGNGFFIGTNGFQLGIYR